MTNKYKNFVRPSSPSLIVPHRPISTRPLIDGETAKKLYLEEVNEVREYKPATSGDAELHHAINGPNDNCNNAKVSIGDISDKDLFITVQNDEVETLKLVLDKYPDKISMRDDYGWSLLMIACQANAVHSAKELLHRRVDTAIRDKAGNSAQSLVIKNKNLVLADLLLSHKSTRSESKAKATELVSKDKKKVKLKKFTCDICKCTYSNQTDHLSSTLHNINASKGKKIPPNFKIPQTNRGYQIMVKVGWDRESGLGPEGSGPKYPIKTVQKKDRKGLGLEKKKEKQEENVSARTMNRRTLARDNYRNRRLEADFRRQFY